jgi:hypothetical protein
MNRLYTTLGLFAAATLLGSTATQAKGFGPGSDCGSAGFSTCAAVHLSMNEGHLTVGGHSASWREWELVGNHRTFEFLPISKDFRPENGDPSSTTGCPVPSGNPHDCVAVTVTPEPVTMTLLATGLLGMSGAGLARRRRQKLVE